MNSNNIQYTDYVSYSDSVLLYEQVNYITYTHSKSDDRTGWAFCQYFKTLCPRHLEDDRKIVVSLHTVTDLGKEMIEMIASILMLTQKKKILNPPLILLSLIF